MKHEMSALQRASLLAILFLVVSCSGPDFDREHEGDAGTGKVGAACSSDEDCLADLICITELPGGSCTRMCPAPDYNCPAESLCVTIKVMGEKHYACASLCADSYHPEYPQGCRDGYSCISVGTQSVCGI